MRTSLRKKFNLTPMAMNLGMGIGALSALLICTTIVAVRFGQENHELRAQMSKATHDLDRVELIVAQMQARTEHLQLFPKTELRTTESKGEEGESSDLARTTISDRIENLRGTVDIAAKRYDRLMSILEDNQEFMRSVPSVTPTTGWISSTFGERVSPFTGGTVMHRGIDIGAETGTIVHAPAAGVVELAGYSESLGNVVVINHGFNIKTKFAHNSKLLVKKGQIVRPGQEISLVGTTGHSTGPHLHYEVWVGDQAVNPDHYLINNGTTTDVIAENRKAAAALKAMGGE